MAYEESSGICRECDERVLIRRTSPNHVLHLLLCLFLCFLWAPVWLFVTLFGKGEWYCTQFGGPSHPR